MSTSSFATPASSLFSRVSYTPAAADLAGVLTLHFRNGDVWRYPGVSADTWHEFIEAPSMGSYYSNFLRGKYTGAEKVKPAPALPQSEEVPS